jgi:transcriptional regulator with XRE-family HTH domain
LRLLRIPVEILSQDCAVARHFLDPLAQHLPHTSALHASGSTTARRQREGDEGRASQQGRAVCGETWGMGKKQRAGQVDSIVGKTIRMLRLAKGMSQTELGEKIGVTFQQVQKYENGANRVSAGRSIQIALALGVPHQSLFEGIRGTDRKGSPDDIPITLLADAQTLRLAQAFSQLSNSRLRLAIVRLVETIVAQEQ